MFRWPDPEREAALWGKSALALEDELDRSFEGANGLAVVVIENFDMLLATLFKDNTAEERLRAWLDRPGNRAMLIATATGTVDLNYERPLFQAFQPVRLEPWSQDDCIAYFNKHRQLDGKPMLDAAMEAKARAIADFIGGNPRLAKLLAEVLETQDALTVAQTMNALADKLADYYRRRIDDLPQLAQGLLDALIRGGEPASQTGLAERVGAGGQNAIARVMQDLQRGDILRGQVAPDGRETLYRVTDRVFVHFYRLRQGNQAAQVTPLTAILDFLRAFYSRDEQRAQAVQHLDAGRPNEARVFADLALEGGRETAGDNDYRAGFVGRLEWLERIEPGVLPASPSEIGHLADAHPERLPERFARSTGNAGSLAVAAGVLAAAQARARLANPGAADTLLAEGAASAEPIVQLVMFLERLLLREWELGDRPGALEIGSSIRRVMDPTMPAVLRAQALRYVAWSLRLLGRHEEAVTAAREAAALSVETGDPQVRAVVLRYAAWSLGRIRRHEEAVTMAREAAALAAEAGDLRGQAEALRHVSSSLRGLGRDEEAVATAREAAALAAEAGDSWEQVMALLHAGVSLEAVDRHEEALTTTLEAGSLAAEVGYTRERAVALVQTAWYLDRLGRHENAVTTAGEAAAVAAEGGFHWARAAALRHGASSLGKLGRHGEAFSLAEEGFGVATEQASDWLIDQSARIALRAACQVAEPSAVRLFGRWMDRDAHRDDPHLDRGLDSWKLWLDELFGAGARARAWSDLDALIADRLARSSEQPFVFEGTSVGRAIARAGADDGRAAGFEAASGILPRIVKFFAPQSDADDAPNWLAGLASSFATESRDPGLICDIAGLLDALGPHGGRQAALLAALAAVDEAENADAVLARTDPDVALWIRRVRDLPEPEPKPRKRKGNR